MSDQIEFKPILGLHETNLMKLIEMSKKELVEKSYVDAAVSNLVTKSELGAKVDKEDGKGLSTEDFTTEYKNKLEGLSNTGVSDEQITTAVNNYMQEHPISGGALTAEQEAKLNEVDNKVDKVLGKGLSTEDFTTEYKNKLEGLSNFSVADGSITPQKTSFMTIGKNLFNKDDENLAHGFINAQGQPSNTSGNYITDFIPVTEGESYVKNVTGEIAFYDADKTHLTDAFIPSTTATSGYSWTIPARASYMRVNMKVGSTALSTVQLEKGTVCTDYEPFKYLIKNENIRIKDIINGEEHLKYHVVDNLKKFYDIEKYLISDIQLLKPTTVYYSIADKTNFLTSKEFHTDINLLTRFKQYNISYINTTKPDGVSIDIMKDTTSYTNAKYVKGAVFYKTTTGNIAPYIMVNPTNQIKPYATYDIAEGWKLAIFSIQLGSVTQVTKLTFSLAEAVTEAVNLSFVCPFFTIAQPDIDIMIMLKDYILSVNAQPNKFEGLKACFIGDSITAQDYYPKYVSQDLNLGSYANRGVGGCTLSDNQNTLQVPIINRYQTDIDADSDIIVLYGGCNDFGQNRTIDNSDNLHDTTTVCGALRTIIEWVYTNFPEKLFLVCNMIPNYYAGREAYDYKNSNGQTIKEYSDAIENVCEEYSVPVADFYRNVGFNLANQATYLQDGVHPTEFGARKMANIITAKIKTL